MIQSQRIIYSDNGVNSDLSVALNDFRGTVAVIPYTAGEDYIYIASDYPFNHKFFDISTPNLLASSVSIDIWYDSQWVPVVDIIDRTKLAGASFGRSGIIQWTTDREKSWYREIESQDVTGITLTGIYNKFWLRMSWSASLTVTTAVNFVGNRFSDDDKLESWYPDLKNSRLKTAFETGKTTWNEQHFVAAQQLTADLAEKSIIKGSGQIMNFEKLEVAAIHKTAEIIYMGLGKAYEENRKLARENYRDALNMQFYDIDKDANGHLSDTEKTYSYRYFSR